MRLSPTDATIAVAEGASSRASITTVVAICL